MDEKPRILVTYGYHLKELFAAEVGKRFAELDMDNVVVARWNGRRGLNRNAQFRRDIGAKYGIDLHDDSRKMEWALQNPHAILSSEIGLKYELFGHLRYEEAKKLILGFKKKWNKMRGINEISESSSFACECYYLTYHMKQPCRANIIALEYLTILSDLRIEEGLHFLEELTRYLQSYGRRV